MIEKPFQIMRVDRWEFEVNNDRFFSLFRIGAVMKLAEQDKKKTRRSSGEFTDTFYRTGKPPITLKIKWTYGEIVHAGVTIYEPNCKPTSKYHT